VVFDTNVFAYALLGPARFGDAAAIALERHAGAICAPETVRAEFLSVAWQFVRAGLATADSAHAAVDDLEDLLDRVEPVAPLRRRALELAIAHDHSPYDTLFLALAEREDVKLVTFDQALRHKFPTLTVTPPELVADASGGPIAGSGSAPSA